MIIDGKILMSIIYSRYKDISLIKVCKKMILETLGLNEIGWRSTNGLPKNSKHYINKTINEISPQEKEKVLYISITD